MSDLKESFLHLTGQLANARPEVADTTKKVVLFCITEPYPQGHEIMEFIGKLCPTLPQFLAYELVQMGKACIAGLQSDDPNIKLRAQIARDLFKQTQSHN